MNKLKNITDEKQQLNELYKLFDEENRLKRSKAARIEFITSLHIISDYLKNNSRILDLGAGVGEYTLFFANKGYEVHAVELVDHHVEKLNKKASAFDNCFVYHQSAVDLSNFDDNSFDVVLLFGPLYHISDAQQRSDCLLEALRVLKDDGTIFVSLINNDIIPLTESVYDTDYFNHGDYNKETFKVDDFPFVFFNLEQSHQMLVDSGMIVERIVTTDGVSELMASTINQMSDEAYQQYIKYHLHYCEDIHRLSMSNHWLFVGYK